MGLGPPADAVGGFLPPELLERQVPEERIVPDLWAEKSRQLLMDHQGRHQEGPAGGDLAG